MPKTPKTPTTGLGKRVKAAVAEKRQSRAKEDSMDKRLKVVMKRSAEKSKVLKQPKSRVPREVKILHETSASVETPEGQRHRTQTEFFTDQHPEYKGKKTTEKQQGSAGNGSKKPAATNSKNSKSQPKRKAGVPKKSNVPLAASPPAASPPTASCEEQEDRVGLVTFQILGHPRRVVWEAYSRFFSRLRPAEQMLWINPNDPKVQSTFSPLYVEPGDPSGTTGDNGECRPFEDVVDDLFERLWEKLMVGNSQVISSVIAPLAGFPQEYQHIVDSFGDILVPEAPNWKHMSHEQRFLIKTLVRPFLEHIFCLQVPGQANRVLGSMNLAYGPPGTGKTRTATAALQFLRALGVPVALLMIRPDQIYAAYSGEGEGKVRDLEQFFKWLGTSGYHPIICLDECDAILQTANDHNQIFRIIANMLKVMAEGCKLAGEHILLFTNEKWLIDDAFISRCDNVIFFGPPDALVLKGVMSNFFTINDNKDCKVYVFSDELYMHIAHRMVSLGWDMRKARSFAKMFHVKHGMQQMRKNHAVGMRNAQIRNAGLQECLWYTKRMTEAELLEAFEQFVRNNTECTEECTKSGDMDVEDDEEESATAPPCHFTQGSWVVPSGIGPDGKQFFIPWGYQAQVPM